MPVQLDKQQLAVLARINRSPDGAMLKIVLKSWLADADSRCRRLEGAVLHQAQGDAQRLEALIDLLEHAEQRLSAFDVPRKPVRLATANWPDPQS